MGVIGVVTWNVDRRPEPWRDLVQMARGGNADLAFLREAVRPPGDTASLVEYDDKVFLNRQLYDRWPFVVKLSDRIAVKT